MRKHPEKKIENWLKKNLHLFDPNLKFVAQQFRCFYIVDRTKLFIQVDILAYDTVNYEHVLIEVKRRANKYAFELQIKKYLQMFKKIMRKSCKGIIAAPKFSKELYGYQCPDNIKFWDLSCYYKRGK